MNIHESAEDYLESILMLKEQIGEVRSIDIVNKMNYSKPSISIAMKKLRESGYITLLPPGLEIAQRIYQRHRLLEKVLIAIGVEPKKAEDEACKIEHDIDDDTYDKIRLFYEKNISEEKE